MMAKTKQPADIDPSRLDTSYPEIPTDEPGLVGGPATEAVPGSHQPTPPAAANVTDDGGETTLPGRSRESGGDRDARPHGP
jgi:hypothetical protein